MPIQETPYRKKEMTLRQIAEDSQFSKGWYAKVADGGDPFVIPIQMFLAQFKSEHHPDLDIHYTAFINQLNTVVLLIQTGYTDFPIVTLLHWTQTLEYSYSGYEDK